jgi:RNA polymerase sigma-70 factor (ECF subfamily)
MENPRPEVAQEKEWIERSRNGEPEAFGQLAERYQRRIFSLVYHFIRRPTDVEDMVQEILVKAFVGIRTYNYQASFGTWLSRVAVNHCYDYLRRQRAARVTYYSDMSEERQRQLESRFEQPDPGGLTPEAQIAARDLVGKLLERAKPEDRIILSLKELDGLSADEIGEVLRIKPSNVKVRLHRARKRMLKDLKRLREGK